MTTTALAVSSAPHIAGRFGFALVLLANALRMSWDEGRASSFDVVLWSGLGITGLYGCTLLASALADRPLSHRILMQLEGLALFVMLAVSGGSVTIASLSGDWVSFGASAFVAAVNGLLLWVSARQLHGPVSGMPVASPHR